MSIQEQQYKRSFKRLVYIGKVLCMCDNIGYAYLCEYHSEYRWYTIIQVLHYEPSIRYASGSPLYTHQCTYKDSKDIIYLNPKQKKSNGHESKCNICNIQLQSKKELKIHMELHRI